MATTQHYIWAAGHFILLVSALRYIVSTLLFRAPSVYWYKASFIGAILSYAIVCRKSLGMPQPNGAWVRRAMLDENVQYLLLAFFWFSSKPVMLALLPYATFSLFHALTFTRTTLMPQFLASGPPQGSSGTPTPHPLARKLQLWVRANYDKAMRGVAFTELVIMGRVLLGAITLQNSLLTPILYAHFLRQRYHQSNFTRDALSVVKVRVDGYVSRPGAPPMLVSVWSNVKALIGRWAGSIIVQQQPAAGAGAQGAAR